MYVLNSLPEEFLVKICATDGISLFLMRNSRYLADIAIKSDNKYFDVIFNGIFHLCKDWEANFDVF